MQKTLIAIVASPLVAFGIAFLAMFLIAGIRKVFGLADNAKPFKWLQLVSAAGVSFGHGANDAQKTMGVIAALLVSTGHLAMGADGNVAVPTWVEFSAYGAIALGTVWGGWKIIETMGLKITTLHASSGVAANIGAVTSIFGATGLGVPISTTHAAASSVAGAGVGSGMGINLKVVGEMVLAWIVTLPTTIVLGLRRLQAHAAARRAGLDPRLGAHHRRGQPHRVRDAQLDDGRGRRGRDPRRERARDPGAGPPAPRGSRPRRLTGRQRGTCRTARRAVALQVLGP